MSSFFKGISTKNHLPRLTWLLDMLLDVSGGMWGGGIADNSIGMLLVLPRSDASAVYYSSNSLLMFGKVCSYMPPVPDVSVMFWHFGWFLHAPVIVLAVKQIRIL